MRQQPFRFGSWIHGADQAPGKDEDVGHAVLMIAPSVTTPALGYFQSAMSSLRARATTIGFLRRPPLRSTRSKPAGELGTGLITRPEPRQLHHRGSQPRIARFHRRPAAVEIVMRNITLKASAVRPSAPHPPRSAIPRAPRQTRELHPCRQMMLAPGLEGLHLLHLRTRTVLRNLTRRVALPQSACKALPSPRKCFRSHRRDQTIAGGRCMKQMNASFPWVTGCDMIAARQQ